jgi:threonine synthase
MRFISTRGQAEPVGFSEAIAIGLAPDGGLFLPESLPDISGRLGGWERLGYAELCQAFLGYFATDIPAAELEGIVKRAYSQFDHPEIAPLRSLGGNGKLHVLELFHGPTLAFKDFALQVLGNLYERQCRLRGATLNLLGATSGDTGAAAIHSMLGRKGTATFILYPDGRVSALQERQMACTGSPAVHALAIDGSFDDAQRVLKEIFGDSAFRSRVRLAAVNSINLARVLVQCVYYLHAWLRLPESRREDVEFVVPTGNFGNVFAGWMLSRMGVPIRSFKVATNQNDILYRMFQTGEYRLGAVHPTPAPSMDIQVASNLERFLYFSLGGDPARVRSTLAEFQKTGACRIENFDRDIFRASRSTNEDIAANVARVHRDLGYVIDPHTACGFQDIDPSRTSVVLATASPAKFPDAIRAAIGISPTHPTLEALKALPIVKHRIPAKAGNVEAYLEAHAAR